MIYFFGEFMIKGIGIDTVDIHEMKRYLQEFDSFILQTFTPAEIENAKKTSKQEEYFATRFAAKEAVFKSLAHLTSKKSFDFRLVETLNHEDGAPFINITEELSMIMNESGVTQIHISLTHETQYASAFVIVTDD